MKEHIIKYEAAIGEVRERKDSEEEVWRKMVSNNMKIPVLLRNLWGEKNMRTFAIIHQSRVLQWPSQTN